MKQGTEPCCASAVSYTPTVRHLHPRLAGLVMTVALTGPQVLAVACGLVCVSDGSHMTGQTVAGTGRERFRAGGEAEPSGHEAIQSSPAPGGHDHHAMTESMRQTEASPTDYRISGGRGSCCPDAASTPVVAVADARTDGPVRPAQVAFATPPLFPTLSRSVPAHLHGPPPALVSSAHRPIVLRI